MVSPAERRRFFRLNLLADLTFTRSSISEEEKVSLTKNISKGGICFIVYEQMSVGEILDLNVYLPDKNKPINVTGRVNWVKEFSIGDPVKGKRFDVGIEFLRISEQDKEEIERYIFKHM